MKKTHLTAFALLIILTACSAVSPTPTAVSLATSTKVATATQPAIQTQEVTKTPEPTATKEIKQFKVCPVENYASCNLTWQDYFSDDYYNFVKTLFPPIENPEGIKKPTILDFKTSITIGKGDELSNPLTSPVILGETSGDIVINDGEVGYKEWWGKRENIALPVGIVNPNNPKEILPVLLVLSPAQISSESVLIADLKLWQSNKFSLGIITNEYYWGKKDDPNNSKDPLVVETVNRYPDFQERINNFIKTGDPTYISAPGFVLETEMILSQNY